MVVILLGQLILSGLALAHQSDVDLLSYDAWDKAFIESRPSLEKIEKTVSNPKFFSNLQVRVLWIRYPVGQGSAPGLCNKSRIRVHSRMPSYNCRATKGRSSNDWNHWDPVGRLRGIHALFRRYLIL